MYCDVLCVMPQGVTGRHIPRGCGFCTVFGFYPFAICKSRNCVWQLLRFVWRKIFWLCQGVRCQGSSSQWTPEKLLIVHYGSRYVRKDILYLHQLARAEFYNLVTLREVSGSNCHRFHPSFAQTKRHCIPQLLRFRLENSGSNPDADNSRYRLMVGHIVNCGRFYSFYIAVLHITVTSLLTLVSLVRIQSPEQSGVAQLVEHRYVCDRFHPHMILKTTSVHCRKQLLQGYLF